MFGNHSTGEPPFMRAPHLPSYTVEHDDDESHVYNRPHGYNTGGNMHSTGAARAQAQIAGYPLQYPPISIPLQVGDPSPYSPSGRPATPNQDAARYRSQDAPWIQSTAPWAGPPASTINQAATHNRPTHRPPLEPHQPMDPSLPYFHMWGGQRPNDVPGPPTFPVPFANTDEAFGTPFKGHHGNEGRLGQAPISQYTPPVSTQPSTPFSAPFSGSGTVHDRTTSYQDHAMNPTPSGMPLPSDGYSAYIGPEGSNFQADYPFSRPDPSLSAPGIPVPEIQVQPTSPQAFPSMTPDNAWQTPLCAPPSIPRSTSPAHRLSANSPVFIPSGLPTAGIPLPSPSRSPADWLQPRPASPSIPPSFASSSQGPSASVTERAFPSHGPSFPLPSPNDSPAASYSEERKPSEVRATSSFPVAPSGHKPAGSRAMNVVGSHGPSDDTISTPPLRPSPTVRRNFSVDYPPLQSSAQTVVQPPSGRSPRMSSTVAQDGSQPTFAQVAGSRGTQQPRPLRPPDSRTGQKKALLIGINYGSTGQLVGAAKDAHNMKNFLMEKYRFMEENILVLTDSAQFPSHQPTRDNIFAGIVWLVRGASKDDSLVFLFSGHGWQVKAQNGNERDGKDEVIAPVDHQTKGVIVDDMLHALMVKPLPRGCQLVALVDACNSGSALDLPYNYDTSGCLKRSEVSSAFMEEKTASADVIMWSGCKDKGKADDEDDGGAMVSAFMDVVNPCQIMTVLNVYVAMRAKVKGAKHTQKPQLSCSHAMDIKKMRFIM